MAESSSSVCADCGGGNDTSSDKLDDEEETFKNVKC